ncbi:MAG: hypothetical protein ACFFAT_13595 [Promethearchaeota archaeon]
MTDVEYKGKRYNFSWYAITFFFISCPLIAFFIIEILELLWIYSYPIVIYPVNEILKFITGDSFSYYPELVASTYILEIPGKPGGIFFVSECIGIQGYAIYAGISFMTPHNRHSKQNRNIYLRKVSTFLLTSILLYLANVLRSVITLLLYYNGTFEFSPMHEIIGYITTFFAVFVFYFVSYFWLPEFSLFVIWMKDDIKMRILGRLKNKYKEKVKIADQETKELKRRYLLLFWIIFAIIFSVIMIYIIFF